MLLNYRSGLIFKLDDFVTKDRPNYAIACNALNYPQC